MGSLIGTNKSLSAAIRISDWPPVLSFGAVACNPMYPKTFLPSGRAAMTFMAYCACSPVGPATAVCKVLTLAVSVPVAATVALYQLAAAVALLSAFVALVEAFVAEVLDAVALLPAAVAELAAAFACVVAVDADP